MSVDRQKVTQTSHGQSTCGWLGHLPSYLYLAVRLVTMCYPAGSQQSLGCVRCSLVMNMLHVNGFCGQMLVWPYASNHHINTPSLDAFFSVDHGPIQEASMIVDR